MTHPRLLSERLLGLAVAATGTSRRPSHVWDIGGEWRAAAERQLPAGPTYIGLAPGAGRKGTGKCWPLEKFLALAQAQQEAGRVPVFFLGPGEREWLDPIRTAAPHAIIPIDDEETGVQAEPAFAMALAQRLAVAVANCSGIGHILAAGGAPMVSLYGPTHPAKYAPYTPTLIALRAQEFGPSGDIANIPLEAVSAAVEKQLKDTASRG